jgi:hypothetical protein
MVTIRAWSHSLMYSEYASIAVNLSSGSGSCTTQSVLSLRSYNAGMAALVSQLQQLERDSLQQANAGRALGPYR